VRVELGVGERRCVPPPGSARPTMARRRQSGRYEWAEWHQLHLLADMDARAVGEVAGGGIEEGGRRTPAPAPPRAGRRAPSRRSP
jgi:hypothetical protein